MELDYSVIKKNKKNLENYKDIIPLILMTYIDNHKYVNNLKEKNLWYDKVQPKIFRRRKKIQFLINEQLIKYEENELKKWIKNNPQFKTIIIN